MNRILILFTIICIPLMSMSQTLSFNEAVKRLYFNVAVKNATIDTVLNEFSKVANEYYVDKGMSSLSINLDMGASGNAKKISHVFKFVKSPLPNVAIDNGYIKIGIGESGKIKKILDIDWCFQFVSKIDAEIFFKELKKIFKPISTIQRLRDDELNLGKYAEFSTRKENLDGIRDVTFFLNKSVDSNKYEVRFVPYNEFVE